MIKYFVGPTLKRKKLRIRSLHHKQRFYREHLTSAPHTHDMITIQDKAQKSHIVNFLQRKQNNTGSSMALWQKITKHIHKKKTARDTQKRGRTRSLTVLNARTKLNYLFRQATKRSYDRVGGIESVFGRKLSQCGSHAFHRLETPFAWNHLLTVATFQHNCSKNPNEYAPSTSKPCDCCHFQARIPKTSGKQTFQNRLPKIRGKKSQRLET